MGAGFALFVAASDAEGCIASARSAGIAAWNAGIVERGARQVVIEPLGFAYIGDDLHLRA